MCSVGNCLLDHVYLLLKNGFKTHSEIVYIYTSANNSCPKEAFILEEGIVFI